MMIATNISNRQRVTLLGVLITSLAPTNLFSFAFTISHTLPKSALRIPFDRSTLLRSSTSPTIDVASITETTDPVSTARDLVISTAQSIVSDSPTGVFIIGSESDKEELNRVVTELEALAPSPPTEQERLLAIGDWELVCTSTTFPSKGDLTLPKVELPSFPHNLSDVQEAVPSLQDAVSQVQDAVSQVQDQVQDAVSNVRDAVSNVQDAVRKSFTVTQRIRSTGSDSDESEGNVIDRVDNVVEYTAPMSLRDLLPDTSLDLDLNPLNVSTSKVVLAHTAEVESLAPVFRTMIKLQNVVVNVAGDSQFFEPEGADVFGINIPSIASDFSKSGSFDTTYVDEKIRVTRGEVIPGNNDMAFGGETLRIFVRKEEPSDDSVEEDADDATDIDNDIDSPSDVNED